MSSKVCVIAIRTSLPLSDHTAGIIFPPVEGGLVKLISCRAFTNYKNRLLPGASILHSAGEYPFDGCPDEIEEEVRSFIRDTVPELAERPFISTKLCW